MQLGCIKAIDRLFRNSQERERGRERERPSPCRETPGRFSAFLFPLCFKHLQCSLLVSDKSLIPRSAKGDKTEAVLLGRNPDSTEVVTKLSKPQSLMRNPGTSRSLTRAVQIYRFTPPHLLSYKFGQLLVSYFPSISSLCKSLCLSFACYFSIIYLSSAGRQVRLDQGRINGKKNTEGDETLTTVW